VRKLLPAERRVALIIRAHAMSLGVVAAGVVLVTAPLVATRGAAWIEFVGAGLVFASAGFALILTGSIVTRDFARGTAQLWFQKPVDPARYYLARFAESAVAWAGLTVLLALAARLGAAWLGWSAPYDLLVALPRVLLTSLVVAAIAFGLSPWLQRGVVVVTLVLVLGGLLVESELSVRAAPLGPVGTPLVRALLFPDSAFRAVAAFASGASDAVWLPLARILAYAGCWIALGAGGVRRALNRHGLAAAQGD